MEKACHTGFSVFFTTSVLWQIVNLEIDIDLKLQRKKTDGAVKPYSDVFILIEQNIRDRNQLLSTFVLFDFDVRTLLLQAQTRRKNLRAILIASVEDHEGVRLSKKILFIQFVSAKLHCSTILRTNEHRQSEKLNTHQKCRPCKSSCLFVSHCLPALRAKI